MILKNTFPNINSEDTKNENIILETYFNWNELNQIYNVIKHMLLNIDESV
ncbi:hypothetical protein HYE11_00895 [Mycoplasmopsis bovis]|nr:hypothetical protein HYE11_00895 [Mycoplasmopsis bovis]